ncbi:MAG: DUF5103 domain-containing protein [Bacteroidetes bacterium]|nr:DUF5103 domain-containing protein [Bacteroidota bacterium]
MIIKKIPDHYPSVILGGIFFIYFNLISFHGLVQDQTVQIDTTRQTFQETSPDTINPWEVSNRIYKENIKTVQLYRQGFELSPPILKFNTNEKLRLAFDDLNADGKEYAFTIIHCNAEWLPSDLETYEYIDGYDEDYIYDFEYSSNTIVPYTHYELEFPTTDLIPKLPGNYILKVYFENPDSVYFTRRLYIVDQKVKFEGSIKQPTVIADRNYKQEVDFSVTTSNYRILNPYKDLKVVVMQNGRWDNAITNLKPKMAVSNKLDYNFDAGENVFDGGNEFRTVDIKSLQYNTESIAKIEYKGFDGYEITLRPDERKTFQQYKKEDDINGRFLIKTEDQEDTNIASEYVQVHFFLPYPVPIIEGSIYIKGELTGWNYSPLSKMTYDYKKHGYTKTMLLKQGFYNYQYVLKYDQQKTGEVSFIEGNHWETENEYTIYLYNREQGITYDKLIGIMHLNSRIK